MTYSQLMTSCLKEKSSWTCGRRVGTACEGAVMYTLPFTVHCESEHKPVWCVGGGGGDSL